MRIQNGLLFLIAGIAISAPQPAQAVVFPDQGVGNISEDENADAISRFGSGVSRRKPVSEGLVPISESSFGTSANRGPASVTEPVSGISAPKGAVIREANRKKAYQEVAVIANDLGFFPSTVFVTEGIGVRLFITGASARSQCFILDDFGIRRQVRNQKVEEIQFTPARPGKYTFNCPMNGAKGTLVVRELDLGERVPASVGSSLGSAVESADSRKAE
jgi:hypothetical protein